jgi:hypothetical protein
MNRLALDMVSLTVKMKELTGRLLEIKTVEEHWKDENFSLAADKAKLEERLRFLEAHVVEVRWTILMEKCIYCGKFEGGTFIGDKVRIY